MDVTNQMENVVHAFEERVRPQMDRARRRVSDMGAQTRAFIKEHPGACLLGAAALGYIIARVARR